MTEAALNLWHDYFITVAQVSATLAGLLFVGLTISLSHVLAGTAYMNRAFVALFLQFEMLLIGIFGVVPGQPVWVVGAEFIVTGLAILAGTSVFVLNFPEDPASVLGSRGPRTVRMVLAWIGTLFPVVTGIGVIADWPSALYFLRSRHADRVLCISRSVTPGCSAVEIPRRMQQQGEK